MDLLLTITTAPCTEHTSSTDDTENRTDSSRCTGLSGAAFHDPFHAWKLGRLSTHSVRRAAPRAAHDQVTGTSFDVACERLALAGTLAEL